MNEKDLFLADESATIAFGKKLAQATFVASDAPGELKPGVGAPSIGAVVYLEGELGAGKTTLARGILRGFGYPGAVKSPTYTLVEPYEFEQCQIYHFDLYRIADPAEVEYLGTEDYFAPGNLCIFEWAGRGGDLIPAPDLVIKLEAEGTGRRLHCQIITDRGRRIAQRMLQ